MRSQIIEEAEEYKIEFYRKREVNAEKNKASNREREKVNFFVAYLVCVAFYFFSLGNLIRLKFTSLIESSENFNGILCDN